MDDLKREREELIFLRCQLGEQEAYRELVDIMEARLFYYVRKFVDDDETALDVLQEVWIAIFKQIRRVKETKSFLPWMYAIAHNRAISCFLKDKAEPSFAAEELSEDSVMIPEPDWDSFDAQSVHKALDRLNPSHRETLVLYFIEGFSYEEIADITNVPLGVVKSRMHYAKKKLREELEHFNGVLK
jgi:RNA polymerase sigma-70 factor (ECF subfamily)